MNTVKNQFWFGTVLKNMVEIISAPVHDLLYSQQSVHDFREVMATRQYTYLIHHRSPLDIWHSLLMGRSSGPSLNGKVMNVC